MSSGRSGAPSGRSSAGPSLDRERRQTSHTSATSHRSGVTSKPITDLPPLPADGQPADSLASTSRRPSVASERGAAAPTRSSARVTQAIPIGDDQAMDAAVAQLLDANSRAAGRAASQQTSKQASARATAAPGARLTMPVATTPESASARPKPAPQRAPTLTQQLRSMQPPDVARQAINELGVLAGELIALGSELEQSGLARIHEAGYFDAARRYGELARRAWLSVAAERLEQDGATPTYRALVVGIARDITRLRRESEVAASNEQFPLPRRRPYLWRSRSERITRALEAWKTALSAPADPRRMGQALFDLRGALNAASVAPVEASLLNLLTTAALWLTPLSGLAAGMASIADALGGRPLVAASFALVTLLAFMLWTIVLLLTSRGRVTLAEMLSGICFSQTRSACNGGSGSYGVAVAMRVWWLLIGGLGALLTLTAVAGSGLALSSFVPLTSLPQAPLDQLRLAAGLLGALAAPAALVATAALVALALPALLVSALRFAAEMSGSRRWVPAARRYALAPALATLSYLTGALASLAWLLAGRLGLAHRALAAGASATAAAGPAHLLISERAPLLALALALPYLALIELPFRLGLGSWRRAWLNDLRTRRTTIEAHVRRLSAPDPRSGAPDTSDQTLRAMQYDLVLLQFYAARISEAEQAVAAPLGLSGALAILVIIVAGALLLDGSAHALAQALTIRLIP